MKIRLMLQQLVTMVLATLLILGSVSICAADDDDWRNLHREVQAGRIKSLPSVLGELEKKYIGQVVEVEFEREDGVPVYEIEMMGPDGQIVEFEVDAASGELIGIEGRNIKGMERQ
ncbi:PepSY domain-containing protein [Marinobacter nanhaiticus]|nr:PepSY domain-containing protein [Marinobacter nanhaiticus]